MRPIDFSHRAFFVDHFGDRVFVVGGAVRDHLLYGAEGGGNDLDLLVVGSDYDELEKVLSAHGRTSTVGKSFAVIKFTIEGLTYDIAVPRRERIKDPKQTGHRNFEVEFGQHVSLEEDLGRRDFTCNALASRLSDGLLVDPYQGLQAISRREIRMTSPQSFFDDPLRILRAARLASVHDFRIEEEIFPRARETVLTELSAERVSEELLRLLLESPRPSLGLQAYLKLGVLQALYPELYRLSLTIQDAYFHPETDEQGHHSVWGHLLIAVDIAARLIRDLVLPEPQALTLLLATLLHDLGKAETTHWTYKRGRLTVVSQGHDHLGAGVAETLLERLRIDNRGGFAVREMVVLLVKNHHRLYELYRNREWSNFKTFARLMSEMRGHDRLLLWLDLADRLSREAMPLDWRQDSLHLWYEARRSEYNLSLETIAPILHGRDLIPLGVSPGPAMGRFLSRLYEAQLDGHFGSLEEGVRLARRWLEDEGFADSY